MKIKLLLAIILAGFLSTCFGQQDSTWSKWEWLTGEWVGEGSGTPGEGEGFFSFTFDLDKNILVRKSHSEYPATANKPGIMHDDLMIVYRDNQNNPTKAIYFDNEKHIINYSITYAGQSIIFTSEKTPDVPVFRLTYAPLDKESVNIKFEMSQDGVKFFTYLDGKSRKKKL